MQKRSISTMKIHIIGPSGSGTSTVGKHLSKQLHTPFFDSDDIFWENTVVPYSQKRPVEGRRAMLNTLFAENDSWTLSGSAMGWGDVLLQKADVIVLLHSDKAERYKRLKHREKEQFGERLEFGNDMYENHTAFMEWAMKYDDGGLDMRSRASVEAWIQQASGRVLRETNINLNETIKNLYDQIRCIQAEIAEIKS